MPLVKMIISLAGTNITLCYFILILYIFVPFWHLHHIVKYICTIVLKRIFRDNTEQKQEINLKHYLEKPRKLERTFLLIFSKYFSPSYLDLLTFSRRKV